MKPPSNASQPESLIEINFRRFLDGYTTLEKAMHEMYNINPHESPQIQVIKMRQIAKEALKL